MIRLLWISVMLLFSAGQTTSVHSAGLGTDGPVPEIIGEGTISTPDDEFGGALSPDGQTIYFNKTVPPHYLYVICESHFRNGKWSQPEILPFSGQYRDTDPVLSPDGQTLLFASDRPVNGKDRHHFYVWRSKKTVNGWSEPEFFPGPVNEGFDQVFASIANNGNVYFTSSRNTGVYGIFRSRLVNGTYQEAEDMGPLFNAPGIYSFEALIAPDESYLLIGSFGRPGGYGNSDLFISYNQNGVWTAPKNLGADINTPAREYSPRLSADGQWLIFTSERGMQTAERKAPITYSEFVEQSRGVLNGLGNLYRIPMNYVLRSTRP